MANHPNLERRFLWWIWMLDLKCLLKTHPKKKHLNILICIYRAETYGAETYGVETYGAETYGFRTFPYYLYCFPQNDATIVINVKSFGHSSHILLWRICLSSLNYFQWITIYGKFGAFLSLSLRKRRFLRIVLTKREGAETVGFCG
jgi:hypothetical protein